MLVFSRNHNARSEHTSVMFGRSLKERFTLRYAWRYVESHVGLDHHRCVFYTMLSMLSTATTSLVDGAQTTRTYRLFRSTPQRPGWRCHSEKIRLTPAWTCSVQSCCQAEQIMVTDCSTSTYTKLVQHETSLLCWCLQTAALAPRWYTADWRHRQQRWHKLCEAWWWLDLWSLAVDMASRTVNQTW